MCGSLASDHHPLLAREASIHTHRAYGKDDNQTFMNMRETSRKSRNRLRQLWAWAGWGLIGSVVGLSLLPLSEPAINFDNVDKLEHGLAYATLMVWFAQLYPRKGWRLIALGFVSLGVVVEVLQSQTGYRTFSYGDMVANAIGVCGGWGLAAAGLSALLTTMETKLRSRRHGHPL
jgi:VanZ family protein